MARYTATIETGWPPEDAFDYVADVRNFAAWDPGVRRVTIVRRGAAGVHDAYDVDVRAGRATITLRYEVASSERPRCVLLRAQTSTLRSIDEIRVEPSGRGATVTYDAQLELRGVLRVASPFAGFAFRRIGDRAAAGLRRALQGSKPEGVVD
jgi:carbon monoxide dehydrogenase subunit G